MKVLFLVLGCRRKEMLRAEMWMPAALTFCPHYHGKHHIFRWNLLKLTTSRQAYKHYKLALEYQFQVSMNEIGINNIL